MKLENRNAKPESLISLPIAAFARSDATVEVVRTFSLSNVD